MLTCITSALVVSLIPSLTITGLPLKFGLSVTSGYLQKVKSKAILNPTNFRLFIGLNCQIHTAEIVPQIVSSSTNKTQNTRHPLPLTNKGAGDRCSNVGKPINNPTNELEGVVCDISDRGCGRLMMSPCGLGYCDGHFLLYFTDQTINQLIDNENY